MIEKAELRAGLGVPEWRDQPAVEEAIVDSLRAALAFDVPGVGEDAGALQPDLVAIAARLG